MKEKKKGSCLKTILAVILIFIILGMIAGLLSGPDDSQESASASGTESESEEVTSYHVGDTVDVNDIKVTLVSAEQSSGSQFLQPEDGNIYVNMVFEIENGSSKDIAVSSMLSFEAYCDDYSVSQSITGAASEGNGKDTLDGSVAAGKKLKGTITYEVPEDFGKLEVSFTPDFWDGKTADFVVEN